jgi:hypothetical protein
VLSREINHDEHGSGVVLAVMPVASVVVYLLMRHPGLRRPQFQGGRAFSVPMSLGCALAVFVVFAWLAFVLQ